MKHVKHENYCASMETMRCLIRIDGQRKPRFKEARER